MKTRLLLLGIVIAAIALVQPLGAASATSSVTVSATVAGPANLSRSAATV
jgi:hypothetical protein